MRRVVAFGLLAACGGGNNVQVELDGSPSGDVRVTVDGRAATVGETIGFTFPDYRTAAMHEFVVESRIGAAIVDSLAIPGGNCDACIAQGQSEDDFESQLLVVTVNVDGSLGWDSYYCSFTTGECGGP